MWEMMRDGVAHGPMAWAMGLGMGLVVVVLVLAVVALMKYIVSR